VTENELAATEGDAEFNIRSLHRDKYRLLAKNRGCAVGFMPDDGTGKTEVFRVEDFELVPIDPNNNGFFFGGDSYVIRYTYNKAGREHVIIYFWQGSSSSQDERAASAIHALRMDDELGGRAVQIRVVQGKEPQHFLRIFRGKLVIFMGGHASGFKNVHDHDSYDVDGTRMFQIRGTCANDVRAVQVEEVARSLNSDDVFVLETPTTTYLWMGKGSSDEEKEFAKNIVQLVSPDRESVPLGEETEPDEFWEAIGGRGDYDHAVQMPDAPLLPTRLFQCVDASGKFRVEEIAHFKQEDLDADDVMILDTGDEVYVWVGNGASDEEKKKSLSLVENYIRTDPTDRSLDSTVILQLHQGEEPRAFTAVFEHWDPQLWKTRPNLDSIKEETKMKNAQL